MTKIKELDYIITDEDRRKSLLTRKGKIYRGDIERIVWKETNVPLKYCRQIIRETVKQLTYYLAVGHRFNVPYFGTFRPYTTRTGTGKVVNSVRFNPNWTLIEKLIPGEGFKRTTHSSVVPKKDIEKRLKIARAFLKVKKVPSRHGYAKSRETEIEENLEEAKVDKWNMKTPAQKRRARLLKLTRKRCPRCKTFKPYSMYNRNRTKPRGISSWCRKCEHIYYRNKRSEQCQRNLNL